MVRQKLLERLRIAKPKHYKDSQVLYREWWRTNKIWYLKV